MDLLMTSDICQKQFEVRLVGSNYLSVDCIFSLLIFLENSLLYSWLESNCSLNLSFVVYFKYGEDCTIYGKEEILSFAHQLPAFDKKKGNTTKHER